MARHARKLRVNLAACTGELLMFTMTAPGGSWSEFDAWQWNVTSWDRFARLRDRAGKQARREVPGVSSRLVAWAPELQERGLLHFHLVFEASNLAEKRWAERYCRYLRNHGGELGFGPQTAKGRWGREDVGRYVGKLGAYLTKSEALRSMWESGPLVMPGRSFYVAPRLLKVTGCTIRRLRAVAYAWAADRVSVPVTALREWALYERELHRHLTRAEILCLPGVTDRGPPFLSAAVESDSAR